MLIIERIKRHNIINGFIFSFIEFASIAILVGSFSIFLFIKQRYLLGWIGTGIACNSLPIMYYSWRSIQHREKAIGILEWLNARTRERINKQYPQSSVDTLIIVTTVILPFIALCLTILDVVKRSTLSR